MDISSPRSMAFPQREPANVNPYQTGSHQANQNQPSHEIADQRLGNGSTINRPRSSSNVSTSFPSSHDAFGLSASPSATSNMTRPPGQAGSNNSSRQSGPWGHTGPNGYGLYGTGHNATMMADTSSNTPSGNQFAHGVLPTSTLLGDPQFRMTKPSGLSQAWGRDEDVDEVPSGTANSDVEQWRHTLDPPTHIRRSQSSFASIPDPKSPRLDTNIGYGMGLDPTSSSSRFSMALRRVSSEHSAVKDSSDIRNLQGDGSMSQGLEHGSALAEDDINRLARTPPKGFRYPFGGKGMGRHRDSNDSMETSGGSDEGGIDRERPLGTGFPPRRRSSIMDTAQPRLLPPNLRKTLAAEANLPMQEIRSEALLQRLILSNSESLPMTPRPSRRGHMLNSFLEADSDDSDDEQDNGNSSDEGPFAVDDLVSGDDANQGGSMGGMDVDMAAQNSSPFAFSTASSTRTPRYSVRPNRAMLSRGNTGSAGNGSFGQLAGMTGEERNDARASQGSARGSDASNSGMDIASASKSNATAWRESPVASGKPAKRKAAFDDARFEPYTKRYRQGGEGSPSHWHATLPPGPIPVSPTGHHITSDPMDAMSWGNARSMNFPRSRGGSPAATSQMQAMRTVSPVTSSPLANMAAAGNAGPIGMPPGMAMGYRPTIGMGGLGMLLMSKRNGQGVGTGLMSNDGETAVAEGIGGMDVRSSGQDDGGEDEMVFD